MPAQSSLAVASVDGRTAVVSARANSPLALLTPRNHGHAAWVYPSNLGGGFVGQDAVRLAVRVEAGATLFLSSQAAGRAYRQSRSRFELRAEVEAGGTLIAWPDPVSCFPGAAFAQRQRFALALDANLLAVDAWSAGRVACGEPWSQARL